MRPQAPRAFIFLYGLVLIALFAPLAHMAWGAFSNQEGLSFSAFRAVLQNSYWMEALGRSLWIGGVSAIGSTFLGLFAVLAPSGKLRWLLQPFLAASMVMPEIVFALTLLLWFAFLHFSLGLVTLILAHITFSLSFSYWILKSRFDQLDPLVFEAAADLGASSRQILLRVTLPLMVPAIVTSVLVGFLLSFDDFLISFFVNGVGTDTLPMKLYASMKTGMSNETNALALVMVLISALAILSLARSRLFKGLLGAPVSK